MIHIMGGLRETAAEMRRREQELRDKQEQFGRRSFSTCLWATPSR
jgi:hypothetical protein